MAAYVLIVTQHSICSRDSFYDMIKECHDNERDLLVPGTELYNFFKRVTKAEEIYRLLCFLL